ncbi:hypothetical protein T265_02841 [Opisthorchis viverrini]|uniref:Uncharacterized protein n=1 Tax=Opisthorchis viverrini TaxID=6198 RepID=A0A074ZXV5_OPIVI|nr:hypothetical protein T265_02841 [Opisthorchis viverrini]KER30802.1 hypothetical protein T265_02841 [Opisthorchis viverrini]
MQRLLGRDMQGWYRPKGWKYPCLTGYLLTIASVRFVWQLPWWYPSSRTTMSPITILPCYIGRRIMPSVESPYWLHRTERMSENRLLLMPPFFIFHELLPPPSPLH